MIKFSSALRCLIIGLALWICLTHNHSVNGNVVVNTTTNGYEGVVVAISYDAVSDSESAELLINNIKELFTEASELLHTATDGFLYFANVTILVPYSWSDFDIIPIDGPSRSEVFHFSAIRIDSMNEYHQDLPYTLQRGDCGEEGDFIHITPQFMTSMNDDSFVASHGDPAKLFIREWGRFRFGLFGEDNPDAFYYNPKRESYMPSYCSNDVVSGAVIDPATKTRCTVGTMDIPMQYCRFEPDVLNNDDITSSLMYTAKLKNVEQFCNESTHNKFAKTQQNQRCGGKSAWSIMIQHKDFSTLPSIKPSSTVPTFEILMDHEYPSVVLAIDSVFSDDETVTRSTLASLTKYLLYTVPNKTTVEVVMVSEFNTTNVDRRQINLFGDREALVNAVEQTLLGGVIVHEGLLDANTNSFDDYSDWSNGVVFYVTSSSNSTGDWSRLKGARFLAVFLNCPPNKFLVHMAKSTDGKAYDFWGDEWDLEEDLDGALYDSSEFWTGDIVVQIASKIVRSGNDLPLPFLIDQEILDHLRFVISINGSHMRGENIPILVSPNEIYHHNDGLTYDTQGRTLIAFSPQGKKEGVWDFRMRHGGDSLDTMIVKVFAVIPRYSPYVKAIVKANTDAVDTSGPMIRAPRLTVTVKRGGSSVSPANVTAEIFGPYQKEGQNASLIKYLHDDGIGADVIRNDGVYSTFLTHIAKPGVYKVIAYVYGGNGIDCIMEQSADCFQRLPSSLYYEVFDDVTMDKMPPDNITDLISMLKWTEWDDTIATLVWTAPGDDYGDGHATGYNLSYFTDWTDAADFTNGRSVSEDMIMSGSLDPLPPNSNQTITLIFPTDSFSSFDTLYLAVRAYDDVGNHGASSSIVIVPMMPPSDLNSTTTPSNSTDDVPATTELPPHWHAYDGVISSFALLAVAMIIATGVIVHQKFCYKPKQEFDDNVEIGVTVGDSQT